MFDETVAIVENKKINPKYYKLTFHSPRLSKKVKPGQFLQIQINPSKDPFLRRPFSYYRVAGNRIEILYEILGRGTGILSGKRKGDELRALGPLGKEFSRVPPNVIPRSGSKMSDEESRPKRVLIAGGVGVPPLIFFAEKYGADYLLIGTKSKAEVMPKKEMARVQAKVLYSTNDGSYGKRGYVTVLLEELFKKEDPRSLYLQTCGPNVMMQAVLDLARRKGIEGEASIDKPMACGLGVCLGCMVKTPKGWIASCTEGPVFNFRDIVEL